MDIERLLRSLNARNVRYVVIGATAFPVHGYARATLDVDFFIDPERRNAERVREALAEFGYDVTDVTVDDLLSKKVLIRQYRLQMDVDPSVKGVSFAQVWANRVARRDRRDADGVCVPRRPHRLKEAAGRPKDLEDLRVLRELRAAKGP